MMQRPLLGGGGGGGLGAWWWWAAVALCGAVHLPAPAPAARCDACVVCVGGDLDRCRQFGLALQAAASELGLNVHVAVLRVAFNLFPSWQATAGFSAAVREVARRYGPAAPPPTFVLGHGGMAAPAGRLALRGAAGLILMGALPEEKALLEFPKPLLRLFDIFD
eukprot:EG_transcript_38093